MRSAVEGDDGNEMIDIAEYGIEDGAQALIVRDVRCAGSSGLDDDGEGERLGAGVVVKGYGLGDAVVGDEEVVRGEFVDVLARFCFDLHGHLHERRADGEGGGGRVLRLLGNGESGRKDQRQSEDKALHSSLLYGWSLVVG